MVNCFDHTFLHLLTKCALCKNGTFLFALITSHDIEPFNSSCVAPQYETGTEFFHKAVQRYMLLNVRFWVNIMGVSTIAGK